MNYDVTVLRALVVMAKGVGPVPLEAFELRSLWPGELRDCINRLQGEGLVAVSERGVRLTLPGLAVATAAKAYTRAKGRVVRQLPNAA